MTPLEMEEAIKELVINELGNTVRVTAFPDNLESYKMLGNAEVLVGYRGGSFEPPLHSTKAQLRTIHFELVVIARSMSGHGGAVGILDRIRLCLQGQKISAFPIRIVKDGYLGRETGQWWYSLEISLHGVPAFAKPEAQYPPIKKISVADKESNELMEVSGEKS